jgi:hydrogenase nickel incorporation protein HypA/HybF
MHEYSLMLALMERVEQEAASRRAVAVRRVRIRIGELSGVEPELLESAFSIVRVGTICENAAVEITRVPAQWECARCQTPLKAGDLLQCAACGAPARLASGDEMLLEQIEMEVP